MSNETNFLTSFCDNICLPISAKVERLEQKKSSSSLKFLKFHRKTFVPESLFNNVLGPQPAALIKRGSGPAVLLWILQNSYEHLFYRTL